VLSLTPDASSQDHRAAIVRIPAPSRLTSAITKSPSARAPPHTSVPGLAVIGK
jgi:hypothetical protein